MGGIGSTQQVVTSAGSTSLAVAGNVTVYTKSFPMMYSEYMSVWYRAAVTGTLDVKIELETSWTTPETEGAADNNYSEPDNLADIESSLAEAKSTYHHKSLNPPFCMFGRFKLTGGASNNASAILYMRVGMQEK